MTKIESKSQLIDNLNSGEKNLSDYRIGTEHEKFVFNLQSKKPIYYEEENGISSLLTKLIDFGWEPINEDNKVIALSRENEIGGGSITLEPAGQSPRRILCCPDRTDPAFYRSAAGDISHALD